MESFAEPENEVRKLQALVKKLEKQNELLRGKQNSLINGNNSPPHHDRDDDDDHHATHARNLTDADDSNRVHGHSSPHSFSSKVSKVGLEDVDVLDIENVSVKEEGEDTWLYTSPKPLTPQESTINVYKWVRQDFDHPSPEVESARRSLVSKLDEAARINRSRSTPAFAKSVSPGKSSLRRSTEGYSHREGDSLKRRSSPHHRHSMPMTGSPLENMGSRIDNGTFIRRKERPRAVMAEKEQNEEGLYHVHEGTNVEKLARQQEESLRQSMSTYTSPKRVLHKSMSIASDTDNSGSPGGSNRSSPRHFDYEGCRHRNSFGSDCSTPPDSPSVFHTHNTHYPDQAHAGKNTTGVSRLQYRPQPSHLSNSSFEYQSAHGSDDAQLTNEARSTSHGPANACHSTSLAANGVRPGSANGQGPSLQRSGLPTPRRGGIPRPSVPSSVRSSVTGSVPRSGIPSHRPNSSAGRAGNWREGCF